MENIKNEVFDNAGGIVLVDYTKTLEQAFGDSKCCRSDNDITAKNFPISPEMIGKIVEVYMKLFHFNCEMRSDLAISRMDKDGFRPATLFEQLAFAKAHPGRPKQYPIFALGSIWFFYLSFRCVPCLARHGVKREIGTSQFDAYWKAPCRFLAVRKVS